MSRFYSNGKLLLTGEYAVLDGATALALPTKYGQDLVVESIQEKQIIWASFDEKGQCWFEAIFQLPNLRLVSSTFQYHEEGSSEMIAETLLRLLQEAQRLNPEFMQSDTGFLVKTHLSFPRDWGLGSSSTLINNIASWAQIDAYQLLWNAFSGSGYDIACAQHDTPIFYQLTDKKPVVQTVSFQPDFADQLYFVHLNQKQNSREGIQRYREKKDESQRDIQRISDISEQIVKVQTLSEFEALLIEHENIIMDIVELPKVQDRLFSDYTGVVKSLGAWASSILMPLVAVRRV